MKMKMFSEVQSGWRIFKAPPHGVKILKVCLGSLNDRGVRRTANLHVFNQGTWRGESG